MIAGNSRHWSIIQPLIIAAIACGICNGAQKNATSPTAKAKTEIGMKNQKTLSSAANQAFMRAFTTEKQNSVKAQKLYEGNIKAYPDDYRNYVRLGVLLAKTPGTKTLSVNYFRKASTFADANPPIWLYMAKVYKSLGNEKDELTAYRKYLVADSENAEVNSRVGLLLLERGERDAGIPFINKAIAKDSGNAAALFALAKVYLRDSRIEEALPLFQKALSADSTDGEVRKNLISVYLRLHMDAEAVGEMKKTVATQRSPATLMPYAQLLVKTGKIAEAAEAVEDLIAIKPDTLPALMLKIEILKREKNWDGVISVCKEIGYIDAHYVPALYERAEAHRQQGKVMWAEKYYRDALKADPKFARAEIGLAEIANDRAKPDDYRKHIMQAYKLNPNDSLVREKYQEVLAADR
jgi:tetratricopeptide (TPR) repeat protein